MDFNSLLQGLWVVVILMNVTTALAAFSEADGPKGRKHLWITAGAVVMLLAVRAVAPLAAPRDSAASARQVAPASPAATAPPSGSQRVEQTASAAPAAAPVAAPPAPATGAAALDFGDALLYLILTMAPLLSILAATLYYLVRRRVIAADEAPFEKWFYRFVMVGGMAVWLWNGLRPTPVIFAERCGLYWGYKEAGADPTFHVPQGNDPPIAHQGRASLRVTFGRAKGWAILHHFPMPPMVKRYQAVEFWFWSADLKHDRLFVLLQGDGPLPYPSAAGVTAIPDYVQKDAGPPTAWRRIRIPIERFGLPDRGIIGIAIGKDAGADQGAFYLDDVRLIER